MELVKVLIQFILQQWCLLIIIWPLTTFHLSGILFLRYCSILLFLLLQCKLLFVITCIRVQRKAILEPNLLFGLYSFQILNGNTDQKTVKEVSLYKHVEARFLRFRPETWTGSICMRVEVYGCEGR